MAILVNYLFFVVDYAMDNKRFQVTWQLVPSTDMAVTPHPRSEAQRALLAMDAGLEKQHRLTSLVHTTPLLSYGNQDPLQGSGIPRQTECKLKTELELSPRHSFQSQCLKMKPFPPCCIYQVSMVTVYNSLQITLD